MALRFEATGSYLLLSSQAPTTPAPPRPAPPSNGRSSAPRPHLPRLNLEDTDPSCYAIQAHSPFSGMTASTALYKSDDWGAPLRSDRPSPSRRSALIPSTALSGNAHLVRISTYFRPIPRHGLTAERPILYANYRFTVDRRPAITLSHVSFTPPPPPSPKSVTPGAPFLLITLPLHSSKNGR
ncbi:hypothetical protein SKAU_G00181290 [Synaphobranchus kaupii]|uniref:Uncharacterized protein n=1 Tax=Synaphobranchus kaupii TaxID=118154 RepID=A0A9Q1IZJ7_SYNKA|nr:hypothetical protein SKAU_G00181290 [Synaphobranchus kaupii]